MEIIYFSTTLGIYVTLRSEAERRMAFLLDVLGIVWEYEMDRIWLKVNQEYYLPDFFLPELGWYLEVKSGDKGSRHVERLHKPYELAYQLDQQVKDSGGNVLERRGLQVALAWDGRLFDLSCVECMPSYRSSFCPGMCEGAGWALCNACGKWSVGILCDPLRGHWPCRSCDAQGTLTWFITHDKLWDFARDHVEKYQRLGEVPKSWDAHIREKRNVLKERCRSGFAHKREVR